MTVKLYTYLDGKCETRRFSTANGARRVLLNTLKKWNEEIELFYYRHGSMIVNNPVAKRDWQSRFDLNNREFLINRDVLWRRSAVHSENERYNTEYNTFSYGMACEARVEELKKQLDWTLILRRHDMVVLVSPSQNWSVIVTTGGVHSFIEGRYDGNLNR